MNIEPKNDWMLVKMVPIKEEVRNGIIILKDTTAQTIQTGEVLLVGPGRKAKGTDKRIPVGVEKGEKVAFFRWNTEHQQGKALAQFLEVYGENVGLIREPDVLFAFTGELRVG